MLMLLLIGVFIVEGQGYRIPQVTVQALKPRGLRVSIPDEPGVQLFAVNANVNKPIKVPESGLISRDTIHPKDGHWVIEVPQTRLKVGDTINYWVYVQADGQQFSSEGLATRITALVDPKQPVSPVGPTKPTCKNTITTVNGKSSCQGKLIFEDTFDDLSSSKWKHDIQFPEYPNFEFVVYSNNEQNSFVAGGRLHVKPTLLSDSGININSGTLELDGCTQEQGSYQCSRSGSGWNILPPIQSARLTTKQAFSFRYGRIEIQAKVPAGDWIFPEIWLEPKSNVYGTKPLESGRIQLVLVRGNSNLEAGGRDIGSRHLEVGCMIGIHNSVHNEMFGIDGADSWSDAFHTYAISWTPDHVTFSVDGREIGNMVPPHDGFKTLPEFTKLQSIPWTRGTKIAPFDQEFYLSIGLGVGGFNQFPDNSNSNNHRKPWRDRDPKAMLMFWRDKDNWYPTWKDEASALQVEHIKVWAL
ncbi:beta-1,3-glucan-binding protein [Anabrus simplex]|uniref:beta-1,3-glucan-binding protein n=1 Tax=Anabrus simplex TaxID=316456 RepID=UPI0035A2E9C0